MNPEIDNLVEALKILNRNGATDVTFCTDLLAITADPPSKMKPEEVALLEEFGWTWTGHQWHL